MESILRKPVEQQVEEFEKSGELDKEAATTPGPGPAIGAAVPYAIEEARELAEGLGKDNYHEALPELTDEETRNPDAKAP
jgi:hypothetical protein